MSTNSESIRLKARRSGRLGKTQAARHVTNQRSTCMRQSPLLLNLEILGRGRNESC